MLLPTLVLPNVVLVIAGDWVGVGVLVGRGVGVAVGLGVGVGVGVGVLVAVGVAVGSEIGVGNVPVVRGPISVLVEVKLVRPGKSMAS